MERIRNNQNRFSVWLYALESCESDYLGRREFTFSLPENAPETPITRLRTINLNDLNLITDLGTITVNNLLTITIESKPLEQEFKK